MLIENNKHNLFKNIASLGVVQIANYVFPLISVPIIFRIIGPDKFGAINFASAFISYFTLLIGYGFDLTATRRVAADPYNEVNRNKVFSEVFTSQLFLLVISFICFLIFLLTLPQLREEKLIAIYCFLTCIATLMTQNWLFQAMQDLPKVAILNLVSKIIFTIVVLLLVHKKSDYPWQPFALSLSQIVTSVLSFRWAVNKYNLKLYKVKLSDCIKLLWSEKVFFFSLCVISMYTNTNIIILGIMHNYTEVGYYTSGQKLIGIIQMVISMPLTSALFPFIGKAFGQGFNKGIDTVQKVLPLVFLFTIVSGLLIIGIAPIFVRYMYGNAFLPAISICRILAFIPMIIALGSVFGLHVMLNLKLDKEFFKVTCFGAIISIILNYFFVKSLGSLGAAYAWVITEFSNLLMLFFILRRKKIYVFNIVYFKPSYIINSIQDFTLKNK